MRATSRSLAAGTPPARGLQAAGLLKRTGPIGWMGAIEAGAAGPRGSAASVCRVSGSDDTRSAGSDGRQPTIPIEIRIVKILPTGQLTGWMNSLGDDVIYRPPKLSALSRKVPVVFAPSFPTFSPAIGLFVARGSEAAYPFLWRPRAQPTAQGRAQCVANDPWARARKEACWFFWAGAHNGSTGTISLGFDGLS
jgi:hypothetical protein